MLNDLAHVEEKTFNGTFHDLSQELTIVCNGIAFEDWSAICSLKSWDLHDK